MAEPTAADRATAQSALRHDHPDHTWCADCKRVMDVLATVRAESTLTDEQIDERIRRYHDSACGYQLKNDALQARVAALEAERAQACARVVELELHLDRYLDPKQWDIWP